MDGSVDPLISWSVSQLVGRKGGRERGGGREGKGERGREREGEGDGGKEGWRKVGR